MWQSIYFYTCFLISCLCHHHAAIKKLLSNLDLQDLVILTSTHPVTLTYLFFKPQHLSCDLKGADLPVPVHANHHVAIYKLLSNFDLQDMVTLTSTQPVTLTYLILDFLVLVQANQHVAIYKLIC